MTLNNFLNKFWIITNNNVIICKTPESETIDYEISDLLMDITYNKKTIESDLYNYIICVINMELSAGAIKNYLSPHILDAEVNGIFIKDNNLIVFLNVTS